MYLVTDCAISFIEVLSDLGCRDACYNSHSYIVDWGRKLLVCPKGMDVNLFFRFHRTGACRIGLYSASSHAHPRDSKTATRTTLLFFSEDGFFCSFVRFVVCVHRGGPSFVCPEGYGVRLLFQSYPSPPSPEGQRCLPQPRLPAWTGHFEPTFLTI